MMKREDAPKKQVKAEAKVECKEEPSAPQGERPAGDELAEQIRAAEEEARGHYDKLLRVMAEFENFKKRMQREREELARYSNEKLLTELLPALDDLDRVLDHVPLEPSDEVKAFADGVALARKSLGATLAKFGLAEVPAAGQPFDPARHDAIAAVESAGHAPGTVVAVHRTGYWLHDRLLRPAMVTVAKANDNVQIQNPNDETNPNVQ